MDEYQIDSTDLRIIKELSKDSRIAFSQLAEKINASNSLIHQRVRKLKEFGILKQPVYLLDPVKLGYRTCAYTQIILENGKLLDSVVKKLMEIRFEKPRFDFTQ